MMNSWGRMVYCSAAASAASAASAVSSRRGGLTLSASLSSAGGRLVTIFSSLSSLLIIFVIVSMTESVPTQDFRAGQKEVVVMSGKSLYWPYSLTGDNGLHGGNNEYLVNEKRTVQPIQLCGFRLLEAVRGLCRGNYVAFTRRSDPDMEDDEHMIGSLDDSAKSTHLHRHQLQNGNHPHNHLRFRRNIIDDCCMKPCSVNEMLRYCGRG